MLGFGCAREVGEQDLFFPQPPFLTEWGNDVRSQTLETADGSCLSIAVVGQSDSGILLYFYGNAEQIDTSLERLRWLHRISGLQVICADYRGYGRSAGVPSLNGLQSDARELAFRFGRVTEGPVLAYGRSIGTIPAIALAENDQIDGLILEAPFTTARDVTSAWSRGLPLLLRPFMRLLPSPELAREQQPIDIMRNVSIPLLIVHGTADEIIPFRLGQRMFEAASSKAKVFCSVPGRGHNNLDIARKPAGPAIAAFMDDLRHKQQVKD